MSECIGPHDHRYINPPLGSMLKVRLPAEGENVAEGCIGETPWAEVVSDVAWKENVGKSLRARIANDPVFTENHGYANGDVVEFVLQMNVHELPMWTATGKAAH